MLFPNLGQGLVPRKFCKVYWWKNFVLILSVLLIYLRFTDKWPNVVWQHWKMLSRFQRNLITMVFVAVVVTVVYYWGLKEQVKLEEQKGDLMNPQIHQPQPQRADLEVSRGRVYTLGFWNMSATKYTVVLSTCFVWLFNYVSTLRKQIEHKLFSYYDRYRTLQGTAMINEVIW